MTKVEINLGRIENTCFVIMPFSSVFEAEYRDIIRPAVEDAGLTCIRADEIYSKPQVILDIWKSLRSARIAIAELSGRNTNVFYEVGIAHALGKPVIIITRNQEDVPFDLKALRYLYYDINDPFWGDSLKKSLTSMIQNVLEKEEDYGTVFGGITIKGITKKIEVIPKKVPSKEEKKPKYDLNGSWKGKMVVDECEYDIDFDIEQKNSELSGKMIIRFPSDKNGKTEISIVQETFRGSITEDKVVFYGLSYTYLHQGASAGYIIDNYFGTISSKGNQISGKTIDNKGHEGEFSIDRKSK